MKRLVLKGMNSLIEMLTNGKRERQSVNGISYVVIVMHGHHLSALPLLVKNILEVQSTANSSIQEVKGVLPLIFAWIATKYKFSYSYLPAIQPHMEDWPKERGAISFLQSGEADIALGTTYPTFRVFKKVDFTTCWLHSSLSILIPLPTYETANISAITQPFQYQVWIMIFLAIAFVLASLYYVNYWALKIFRNEADDGTKVHSFGKVYSYASQVLLTQGGVCFSKRLAVRITAACWCLVCFILGSAYSSTLISHLTARTVRPIIETVNDIPQVPGLKVTIVRGETLDITLQYEEKGVMKYIADMLRNEPQLRCKNIRECLDLMADGRHVYIDGAPVVQSLVYQDRVTTGSCHYSMAKDSFSRSPIVLTVRRPSPYKESINRGLLQLWQIGLMDHWMEQHIPYSSECLDIEKRGKEATQQRLNVAHFSGAFILWLCGFGVSLLVFVLEGSMNAYFTAHQVKVVSK